MQRYKIFTNNKFHKRMPRLFMPEEVRSQLTFSSQTILLYVIATLPQCHENSDNADNTDFHFAQELEIKCKHFVDNKILSNKKFYEGLNQLIELEYLCTDPELPKNTYICNPYYIDNLNKAQRNNMNAYIRDLKLQDTLVNFGSSMPEPPLL